MAKVSKAKKVTIGMILFGTKYLKESLPTLIVQDHRNVEYIFRDQEEGEHSAYTYIKNHLPEVFKKVKITKGKNLMHSGGHNAIINEMTGEYYFCCSNDMLYPKDFISKAVQELEKNPQYSFATCKILKWDYEKNKKTNIIDSFGIAATQYHHFYDIGQGEEDKGQYDNMKEPFGTSGALSIFTKQALQKIKYKNEKGHNEYYDELMHYKNDVDLSYRLRWAGEKPLLIHTVTVHHDRQVQKQTEKTYKTKASSFLGERILMDKNYSREFSAKIRAKTTIYHFLKKIYLLITNPKLFKELRKLKALRPQIQKKKQAIKKEILPRKIQKWLK